MVLIILNNLHTSFFFIIENISLSIFLCIRSGADSGFQPGGGRDFLGTNLKKKDQYSRKKVQHPRKRNKTQEQGTKFKKMEQNSRKRNKTQEKGTQLKKK